MTDRTALNVRKFVTLSTGHLTEETAKNLDNLPAKDWPVCGGPFNIYGWFMWVSDPNDDPFSDLPADLRAVFTFCRNRGFQYVLFDCDEATIEELPYYEW